LEREPRFPTVAMLVIGKIAETAKLRKFRALSREAKKKIGDPSCRLSLHRKSGREISAKHAILPGVAKFGRGISAVLPFTSVRKKSVFRKEHDATGTNDLCLRRDIDANIALLSVRCITNSSKTPS
jgi:hypothetical protein